jgi:hypothetical protein
MKPTLIAILALVFTLVSCNESDSKDYHEIKLKKIEGEQLIVYQTDNARIQVLQTDLLKCSKERDDYFGNSEEYSIEATLNEIISKSVNQPIVISDTIGTKLIDENLLLNESDSEQRINHPNSPYTGLGEEIEWCLFDIAKTGRLIIYSDSLTNPIDRIFIVETKTDWYGTISIISADSTLILGRLTWIK